MKIAQTNIPPWQDQAKWGKLEKQVYDESVMLWNDYESNKQNDPTKAQEYLDEAKMLDGVEEGMFNCDAFPPQNDPDDRKLAYESALATYQDAVKKFGPPKQYI